MTDFAKEDRIIKKNIRMKENKEMGWGNMVSG